MNGKITLTTSGEGMSEALQETERAAAQAGLNHDQALEGRLDTITAPDLEEVMKENIAGVKKLVFDFTKLEYISSAGLRVIVSAQKIMNKQGEMQIVHANEMVRSVFEITGMDSIIHIG